ncbi:MAG: hypothetical protein A2V77_16915 [Anaeromyxobacter sp. RBG_16_69_14]|nr:MAG: hypothetical protein A2V77_16915 [Anaeromyxobacter sp. RBG_16_69_14]
MTNSEGALAIELRPDQQEQLEEIAAKRGVELIVLLAEAMGSWSATHGRDGLSGLDARFRGRSVDADALTEVGREAVDWWLRSPHVRDAS